MSLDRKAESMNPAVMLGIKRSVDMAFFAD